MAAIEFTMFGKPNNHSRLSAQFVSPINGIISVLAHSNFPTMWPYILPRDVYFDGGFSYSREIQIWMRDSLGAIPFISSDETWQRYILPPLITLDCYWWFPNKKAVNGFQNVLDYEIGFYKNDSEHVNDHLPYGVVESIGDKKFIGINLSVASLFLRIANEFFCDDAFMPFLGSKTGIKVKHRSRFESDCVPTWSFDALVEKAKFYVPTCPIRQKAAALLFYYMLEAVVNHELAHLVLGHVDFIQSKFGARSLSETVTEPKSVFEDTTFFRSLLELEADKLAVTLTAHRLVTPNLQMVERALGISIKDALTIAFVAHNLVISTWAMCDSALSNKNSDTETYSTHGTEWKSYPPSWVRAAAVLVQMHDVFIKMHKITESFISDSMGLGLLQITKMEDRNTILVHTKAARLSNLLKTIHVFEWAKEQRQLYAELSPYRYKWDGFIKT